MGQNREIRQSWYQNELIVEKPSEIIINEKETEILSPEYDFQTEVRNDAGNEERLFFMEFVVIFILIVFVIIRSFLLS